MIPTTELITQLGVYIHKKEYDKLKAQRDNAIEMCRRAWVVLDAVEPNNPITYSVYKFLASTLAEGVNDE